MVVFKYFPGFSGTGEVYLNISLARRSITYLIPLRRRRSLESIYKHLSGAREVFIHTYLALEKYLYTPFISISDVLRLSYSDSFHPFVVQIVIISYHQFAIFCKLSLAKMYQTTHQECIEII